MIRRGFIASGRRHALIFFTGTPDHFVICFQLFPHTRRQQILRVLCVDHIDLDVQPELILQDRRHNARGVGIDDKVNAGFDVLEIAKGNWTEAIFAKKKEPVEKLHFAENQYDEEGNLIERDEELPDDPMSEEGDEDNENDETFYSSYAPEADVKEDDEDMSGLSMEE